MSLVVEKLGAESLSEGCGKTGDIKGDWEPLLDFRAGLGPNFKLLRTCSALTPQLSDGDGVSLMQSFSSGENIKGKKSELRAGEVFSLGLLGSSTDSITDPWDWPLRGGRDISLLGTESVGESDSFGLRDAICSLEYEITKLGAPLDTLYTTRGTDTIMPSSDVQPSLREACALVEHCFLSTHRDGLLACCLIFSSSSSGSVLFLFFLFLFFPIPAGGLAEVVEDSALLFLSASLEEEEGLSDLSKLAFLLVFTVLSLDGLLSTSTPLFLGAGTLIFNTTCSLSPDTLTPTSPPPVFFNSSPTLPTFGGVLTRFNSLACASPLGAGGMLIVWEVVEGAFVDDGGPHSLLKATF